MTQYIARAFQLLFLGFGLTVLFVLFSILWNYFSGVSLPESSAVSQTSKVLYDSLYCAQIKKAKDILKKESPGFYSPGYSVCVGVNDGIVWSQAFGYADLENKRPTTIYSRFPIGSLSKPVTATAAMILCEEGMLELHADVREYVPQFPEKKYGITIENLLSHQSGIRHYRTAIRWPPPYLTIDRHIGEDFSTSEQRLGLFANDTLLFEPGTDYLYSTFGYTLIGEAMSNVTDMNFLRLMEELVFEPQEMVSSSADYYDQDLPDRVTSYNKTIIGRRVTVAPKENCSYKWAGGGMLSTPSDLARFGLALMGERIISDSSFLYMLRPKSPFKNSPFQQFHGVGWNFYELGNGHKLVNFGGSPTGGQASMVMIPETGVVVVILTNAYIYGSLPLKLAASQIAQEFSRTANDGTSLNKDPHL